MEQHGVLSGMSIAAFLFLQAVKEHITEKYDLDYEVFSQPLQFDNHLKLEVAEEEAKRQGYKITPLIDNAIVRLEKNVYTYIAFFHQSTRFYNYPK